MSCCFVMESQLPTEMFQSDRTVENALYRDSVNAELFMLFIKMKTEVFESVLVWTGRYQQGWSRVAQDKKSRQRFAMWDFLWNYKSRVNLVLITDHNHCIFVTALKDHRLFLTQERTTKITANHPHKKYLKSKVAMLCDLPAVYF